MVQKIGKGEGEVRGTVSPSSFLSGFYLGNPPFAVHDHRREDLDTYWVSTFDLNSILAIY